MCVPVQTLSLTGLPLICFCGMWVSEWCGVYIGCRKDREVISTSSAAGRDLQQRQTADWHAPPLPARHCSRLRQGDHEGYYWCLLDHGALRVDEWRLSVLFVLCTRRRRTRRIGLKYVQTGRYMCQLTVVSVFMFILCYSVFVFSALTLFGIGREHPAHGDWLMKCWRGYLSAVSAHMVQLLLLPLHHSCFIQNGLLFWNQLTQVLLEKEAIIKWVFVCLAVYR